MQDLSPKAALGHNLSIIASTQRSLERLLLSETCRIVSFRTSARADEGSSIRSVCFATKIGCCNFVLTLNIKENSKRHWILAPTE